jgi:hypothetical protein
MQTNTIENGLDNVGNVSWNCSWRIFVLVTKELALWLKNQCYGTVNVVWNTLFVTYISAACLKSTLRGGYHFYVPLTTVTNSTKMFTFNDLVHYKPNKNVLHCFCICSMGCFEVGLFIALLRAVVFCIITSSHLNLLFYIKKAEVFCLLILASAVTSLCELPVNKNYFCSPSALLHFHLHEL